MTLTRFATCTRLDVAEGAPLPTEFLLFKQGENPTSKGVYTLTPESAKGALERYMLEGVELTIDLNHDMFNEAAQAARSDALDARGWFKLELRADGSLWAADVRWTPDGEERLRSKKQRYISPAFGHTEEGLVTYIANAALCAMPATYNAPALCAKPAEARRASVMVNLCKALLVHAVTQSSKVKK